MPVPLKKLSPLQFLVALSLLVGLSPLPTHAGRYANGVHLVNRDVKAHQVVYRQPARIRICWTRKPDRYRKKGLAPAHMRRPRGFRVLEASPLPGGKLVEIRALVAPGTRVNCICTGKCRIQVLGVGRTKLMEDRIVTIGRRRRLLVE